MATRTAVQTGNWNAAATWDGGLTVPAPTDDVIIIGTAVNVFVTIPDGYDAECASLSIEEGPLGDGILRVTGAGDRLLTVTGAFSVEGSEEVRCGFSVVPTGEAGDLTLTIVAGSIRIGPWSYTGTETNGADSGSIVFEQAGGGGGSGGFSSGIIGG